MDYPNDRFQAHRRASQPWPSAVLPPRVGQGSPGNTAVLLLGLLTLVTFAAVATILATLLLPLLAAMIGFIGESGLADVAVEAFRWLLGIWSAGID